MTRDFFFVFFFQLSSIRERKTLRCCYCYLIIHIEEKKRTDYENLLIIQILTSSFNVCESCQRLNKNQFRICQRIVQHLFSVNRIFSIKSYEAAVTTKFRMVRSKFFLIQKKMKKKKTVCLSEVHILEPSYFYNQIKSFDFLAEKKRRKSLKVRKPLNH